MAIRAILWDIDDTLLAFPPAEAEGLRLALLGCGLPAPTAAQTARYSAINLACWKALERGELSREALRTSRFRRFFAETGWPADLVPAVAARYEAELAGQVFFVPGALELLRALRGRVAQYAASNGTRRVQLPRLARAGLDALLDGVFLSETIGAEKPDPAFFDAVCAALPGLARREILMIGDSLSSDVLGGLRSGLVTCWYNPEGKPLSIPERPDYEIRSLAQLPGVLEDMGLDV
ncbi:MAG: YjjG family noncanonical pyrimidine nucleotidase [Oscillospiraceae bacterium]|nr:YjjG family noncanonical pyrimidine nucleotidase [Oscillospiraceae bacterium]